jgi:phage gp36-like protein
VASYATPADLVTRYDHTTIKDLASDTGEPIADVTDDSIVLAALQDASGKIDAALSVSQMYDPEDDLEALTGNSLALLKLICCQLAMAFLLSRRPEKYGQESISKVKQEAEEYLEMLRRGERVFGSPAHEAAGLPTIDGMSSVDYTRLNMLRDRMQGFFVDRGKGLPIGRA